MPAGAAAAESYRRAPAASLTVKLSGEAMLAHRAARLAEQPNARLDDSFRPENVLSGQQLAESRAVASSWIHAMHESSPSHAAQHASRSAAARPSGYLSERMPVPRSVTSLDSLGAAHVGAGLLGFSSTL